MNNIYRTIWCRVRQILVPVSEISHGQGKHAGVRKGRHRLIPLAHCVLAVMPLALLLPAAAIASPFAHAARSPEPVAPTHIPGSRTQPAPAISPNTNPTGGKVVSGRGVISSTGNATTIKQGSQNLSLDWQSFDIGSESSVTFLQPNEMAIAVNRVLGNDASTILGKLDANGRVFLINPNGVLFGEQAQVNVGGLVASTLDFADSTLGSDRLQFSGESKASVINRGTITADTGGYVALLGHQVSNQGVISARLGSVALAGGSAVTLNFDGSRLVDMEIDRNTLNALAENRQLIVADGGQVLMSAGAKDSLLASVVNNTGVVQAQTVDNRDGRIVLLGGMEAGSTHVEGTLDASAPSVGDGGFIETSAAQVHVAEDARITTAAATGVTGTWLIDPQDYTIAAEGGDITGSALMSNLANTNVVIESSAGAVAGKGDINVRDNVSWSANTLTLTAARDINVNALMDVSGSAGLTLNTGTANGGEAATAGVVNVMPGLGRVDLDTDGMLTVNGNVYTIIRDINALQNIGLTGYYALGRDIDASATSEWNGGKGFTPIGDFPGMFSGQFNGLGHVISGLTVNQPDKNYAGLFGYVSQGSLLNVGLVDANIKGSGSVGGLAGVVFQGSVRNAYFKGQVSGLADVGSTRVGGLVGENFQSPIANVFSDGEVSSRGGTYIHLGGLIGYNRGDLSNAYSGSNVKSSDGVTDSFSWVGGLTGLNTGAIVNSYATGDVNSSGGAGSYTVGGLVGFNSSDGSVGYSYASGDVSGSAFIYGSGSATVSVGAALGLNGATATNVYASGDTAANADGSGSGSRSFSVSRTGGNITPAGMMNSANFSGWNISTDGGSDSIWRMYEGHSAPLLRSFMPKLVVKTNDATSTYNGSAWSGAANYSLVPGFGSVDASQVLGTAQSVVPEAINAGDYALQTRGLYSTQQGYDLDFVDGTLTINPFVVSLDGSRVYDGTTAVGADSLLLGTLVGDQTLVLSGAGQVADKNAGTGKALSLGSLSLGNGSNGGLASNYTLAAGDHMVDITPKTISVDATAAGKVYDGTTGTTSTVSAVGVVRGDDLQLTSTAANFEDKNAGKGKQVTVSGVRAHGTDAGNYRVAATAITTADVTPKQITVGADGGNKVYDGTRFGTVSLTGDGVLSGDIVSFAGDGVFADKNVGTAKSVTVSNITANGADAGNYEFNTSAATVADITQRHVSVEVNARDKVYDATTSVDMRLASSGIIDGDSVTFDGDGSFDDKNAGVGKSVTVTGITAGGSDAANYSFSEVASGTADIFQRDVTLTVSAQDKVYDATTSADTSYVATGLIDGDSVDLGVEGSFGDKHVGDAKAVEVDVLATGSDAGNYNFVVAPGTIASITPRQITVGAAGGSKVYDGTTGGTVTLASDGVLDGDNVLFTGAGVFADKNVGTNKAVTVSGITADGADAGNYSYNTSANTTADVTQLGIVVDATGVDKIYDATTNATVILASDSVIEGDVVIFQGNGQFEDKNVGTGKRVDVDGIAASGTDAANYKLLNLEAETSADITPRAIDVDVAAQDKVYDATTVASATLGSAGILDGDDLSFTGTATFEDRHAGTDKVVHVADISASGTDAGNYSFDVTAAGRADIDQLEIAVNANAADKVYDGTTAAQIQLSSDGVLDGDSVSFNGTARFDNKNVGAGKTVGVTGITANGGDAGNYRVVGDASATADITPATLVYVADPTFVLFGQSDILLTGRVEGFVNGESLENSTQGNLVWTHLLTPDSPAGRYSVTGEGLSADNYIFTQAPGNETAMTYGAPVGHTALVAAAQQVSEDDEERSARTGAPLDISVIDGGVRLP